RLQPLHAAAFLIYEDGRVGPPDRIAKGSGQIADFIGVAAIPFEQNQAERPLSGEESALFLCKTRPGNTGDECLHRLARTQSPPADFRSSHRRCASLGENGPTRARKKVPRSGTSA